MQQKVHALAFTNRRPRTSRICTFCIPHAQISQPFVVLELAIKFGNSKKDYPNSYSCLKEFQKEQTDPETSVIELDLEKSMKSAPKKKKKRIALEDRLRQITQEIFRCTHSTLHGSI